MRALVRSTVVALLLCFAAPVSAEPLEDAHAAYLAGDYATALRIWRPLADQGFAGAQYNLGMMYGNGRGVPQDYLVAAGWFRKAADQGDADAQYNLGGIYLNGQGVPQDYVQAHKWLNIAASRYTASETKKREAAVKGRDNVAAKMTPAQIAEAQKLAREWKPTKP